MRPLTFENKELTEKEKRSIDILEMLRRLGPLSRPEISQKLGVNIVTVSHYIESFIKNSLLKLDPVTSIPSNVRVPLNLAFLISLESNETFTDCVPGFREWFSEVAKYEELSVRYNSILYVSVLFTLKVRLYVSFSYNPSESVSWLNELYDVRLAAGSSCCEEFR